MAGIGVHDALDVVALGVRLGVLHQVQHHAGAARHLACRVGDQLSHVAGHRTEITVLGGGVQRVGSIGDLHEPRGGRDFRLGIIGKPVGDDVDTGSRRRVNRDWRHEFGVFPGGLEGSRADRVQIAGHQERKRGRGEESKPPPPELNARPAGFQINTPYHAITTFTHS